MAEMEKEYCVDVEPGTLRLSGARGERLGGDTSPGRCGPQGVGGRPSEQDATGPTHFMRLATKKALGGFSSESESEERVQALPSLDLRRRGGAGRPPPGRYMSFRFWTA